MTYTMVAFALAIQCGLGHGNYTRTLALQHDVLVPVYNCRANENHKQAQDNTAFIPVVNLIMFPAWVETAIGY